MFISTFFLPRNLIVDSLYLLNIYIRTYNLIPIKNSVDIKRKGIFFPVIYKLGNYKRITKHYLENW